MFTRFKLENTENGLLSFAGWRLGSIVSDSNFAGSRELYEEASKFIAGGVNSNVRLWERPHPMFFARGDGPYLYDVDGNRFIDYVLGQGPMLLGHSPRAVVEAVSHQLDKGVLYGAQHETEVEVARLVTEMVPSAEVVRFNMTGTEAVQAALRIARAATGRQRIVKFEGHYHGWADSVLFNVGSDSKRLAEGAGLAPVAESAGIAAGTEDLLLIAPWNDASALEAVIAPSSDSIAAVIMEPIMANSGVIEPQPGYLEAVRQLCDRHGILLIFDEVITGFRVHAGGAQDLYGVTPDLTTMGKAMASGFPIGCVAGKRHLFEGIARGEITHAGTFNASPISMAAALASLGFLRSTGPSWYADLEAHGRRLMTGLDEVLADHGVAHLIQGRPTIFNIMFTDQSGVRNHQDVLATDAAMLQALLPHLMASGVRIAGHGNVFLSDAHDAPVIDDTLARVDRAVATWISAS